MYNGNRILAVIPARGGSKGIKNKNIIMVNNKPLISFTIEAAQNSKYIDSVVVSTDSEQIAEVAENNGAEIPYIRPDYLATDTSKTIDVILDIISFFNKEGRKYDVLVLLQPTSPLRDGQDIDSALELFFEKKEVSLLSISKVNEHPILMRNLLKNNQLKQLISGNSTIRRQDMKEVYRINGAIYINKIDEIDEKTSFNDNQIGYVMPREKSVDIDEPVDLAIVNYYINNKY